MSTDGRGTPAIAADLRARLAAAGLDPDDLTSLIERAVAEDLDGGVDVTTVATVPPDQRATLDLVARRGGIVAGVPVAAAVFSYVCGPEAAISLLADDGAAVIPGQAIVSVTGSIPRERHDSRMVGNRWSQVSAPSMRPSSHTWAEPSSRMRRMMALATTSRGARSASGCSSAMNRRPAPSSSMAPSPRTASDTSGCCPCARRPAGRIGARTSRNGTTRAGACAWSLESAPTAA